MVSNEQQPTDQLIRYDTDDLSSLPWRLIPMATMTSLTAGPPVALANSSSTKDLKQFFGNHPDTVWYTNISP